MDLPLLLQIILIISRSPVPFYGLSIAFTYPFYRLQVTCTFLRTIHTFYRSFLSFPGRLYLFTNHPLLLPIIPIVSRSPVPFYEPSIAFPDHSYRLPVTCTFLQSIHSFYSSFLSSPGQLYQPIPFYEPSIAFTDHSYRLQVTCTFLQTIHSFYRSFLSSSRSPVPFY